MTRRRRLRPCVDSRAFEIIEIAAFDDFKRRHLVSPRPGFNEGTQDMYEARHTPVRSRISIRETPLSRFYTTRAETLFDSNIAMTRFRSFVTTGTAASAPHYYFARGRQCAQPRAHARATPARRQMHAAGRRASARFRRQTIEAQELAGDDDAPRARGYALIESVERRRLEARLAPAADARQTGRYECRTSSHWPMAAIRAVDALPRAITADDKLQLDDADAPKPTRPAGDAHKRHFRWAAVHALLTSVKHEHISRHLPIRQDECEATTSLKSCFMLYRL